MLSDHQQRLDAIDPQRSFIVQAPAGSGKTELLSQRFLRLLSIVSAPEQIVALTFTRKAANEMRERILHTLQAVAHGAVANSPHQEYTYALAKAALAQNKHFHWQLLEQPQRLRVMTIDALCQTIYQAIPLQEKQIPRARISDMPKQYYEAAARACLDHAIKDAHYQDSVSQLLYHLDNQQDHLLNLWCDLLSTREQWLGPLMDGRTQEKAVYEHALYAIEQSEIQRFCEAIPIACKNDLLHLAQRVACIEANPNSPRYPLRDWISYENINHEQIHAILALLLTTQATLRKSFDQYVGLTRDSCSKNEYQRIKEESKALLQHLTEAADFLPALLRLRYLPRPEYNLHQWDTLQALFRLLPLLLAHLHLVFSEHNCVDFSEIAQQASRALGDEDTPTDLGLYLDHRIHHLLVDEFQDTSLQQYHFLEQLVRGFESHDGKTVFLVGDPMQSIYRFRGAEVGLFLRAKETGLGPVPLIPLTLRSNFRSTRTIVEWINQQSHTFFPIRNDIASGAVSFSSSHYVLETQDDSFVHAYQYPSREAEAENIADIILQLQTQYSNDTIAILVRSRRQLAHIIPLLRKKNIPFQGVQIDFLAYLPHLRDVYSLTQALLVPANRLAWLSFLRSPWCGLSLVDVHALANYDKQSSIYYALSRLSSITNLSDEGRLRAEFVYEQLHQALRTRQQYRLVDWLMLTLRRLHIDSVLSSDEQEDLHQYWELLDRFDQSGQLTQFTLFRESFNTLYSQRTIASNLHIMTIHKAKGLEFDTVFLPGLSTRKSTMDKPLLRWLHLPAKDSREFCLLSPIKAAHHERCPLYDYLTSLEAQKDNYEQQRLLYVALTRAKKRVYLFDYTEKTSSNTFRYLLKHQPFITIKHTVKNEVAHVLPLLYRLPIAFYPPITPKIEIPKSAHNTIHVTTNPLPRIIGIVAHTLLQWAGNHHINTIEALPWELAEYRLRSFGLDILSLEAAIESLQQQLSTFFSDPVGRWIMQPHQDEHNEYPLLVKTGDELATRIIDRIFFENGIRWIIDFKTGEEDANTHAKHTAQLNEYTKLVAALKNDAYPIRCGIYYLSPGHWITWEAENSTIYS